MVRLRRVRGLLAPTTQHLDHSGPQGELNSHARTKRGTGIVAHVAGHCERNSGGAAGAAGTMSSDDRLIVYHNCGARTDAEWSGVRRSAELSAMLGLRPGKSPPSAFSHPMHSAAGASSHRTGLLYNGFSARKGDPFDRR
jgi:hypothetical protein